MICSKNSGCFVIIQSYYIFVVMNVDAAKSPTAINRQINNDN